MLSGLRAWPLRKSGAGSQPAGVFSGERSFAASGSLLPTDAGKVIAVSASGVTITLPLLSTVPLGTTFHFSSAVRFFIARAGSDLISDLQNVLPTLTCSGNFTLVARGSFWQVSVGFSRNQQGNPGFQSSASGIITQWGSATVTLNGSSGGAINFPMVFPTAVYMVSACLGDNNLLGGVSIIAAQLSTSSFGFQVSGAPGAVPARINWHAYGN